MTPEERLDRIEDSIESLIKAQLQHELLLDRLMESQHQVWQSITRLSEAQRQLTEAQRQLTEAQRQLTEAQQRSNGRLDVIEEKLQRLIETVDRFIQGQGRNGQ
ncbi:MAG: hypothetical protein DMG13_23360 [Acidobacteria bacterium]|nr:MAG: hypothetical protein DMG13_23360 [Acidobacteriota bacterium]